MNKIKSQHKNSNGEVESLKLDNDTIVSKSEVIKNITENKETYSYRDNPINVVGNKWIRTDNNQRSSDDLGSIKSY